VNLDGLPADHVRVLLDGLPIFERHGLLLAGGYAFRAQKILHRPSQDLDFATREGTPLPEIAEDVRQAFQAAGYGAHIVEATGRYARLVLRIPGSASELEVDLLKEALGPGYVAVQVEPEASVRALSLEDAVGLKARAWHDRFVIRTSSTCTQPRVPSRTRILRPWPAATSRTSIWKRSWIISPESACLPMRTSPNTGLTSRRSPACAGGSRRGTTISAAASPRRPLAMNLTMSHNPRSGRRRREPVAAGRLPEANDTGINRTRRMKDLERGQPADVLRSYLRSESIAPLPLQRLAAAYPDTVDAVFRKILRRRDFTWAEHGEALMRRRKAWYYQREPRPGVSVIGARLAELARGGRR
jgi:hypothetical protein